MSKQLALVETDLATVARAGQALEDFDAWLLSLPGRRHITADDVARLARFAQLIRAGLAVVRKYLAAQREG